MAVSALTLDSSEEINPYLKVEWYAGGRILCMTMMRNTDEDVDLFVKTLDEQSQRWKPDQFRLNLFDVGYDGITLTAYMRQNLEELSQRYGSTHGRRAVILVPSFMSYTLRLFLMVDFNRRNKNNPIKIFFSREDALKWLGEALPPTV